MKKILSFLSILAISVPTSLSVVACGGGSTPTPTYNTIIDGIKSLKLNSFALKDSTVTDVTTKNIVSDIFMKLVKLKFSTSVAIDPNNLAIKTVINNSTSVALTNADLTTEGVLNLNVTATYDNVDAQLSSSTLNVTNAKTDQQVSDYINAFDYNSFLQSQFLKNKAFSVATSIADLNTELKAVMTEFLGSYGLSYINDTKLTLNSINVGNNPITQNDLNKIGDLTINVNYTYGTVSSNKISFTITIVKLNLSETVGLTFNDLSVSLTGATNTIV